MCIRDRISSTPSTRRNIPIRLARSRRTSGSPPVTRTFSTPIEASTPTRRTISSKLRISSRSSQGSPSAGMQYWQRKLQRSVTETRRSDIRRPWPSRRGSSAHIGGGGRGAGDAGGEARAEPGEGDEEDEAEHELAGGVLDDPHHQRREEAAEPAGGPDDPGRGAGRAREVDRHLLEHGAVAEAEEGRHRQREDRHRDDRGPRRLP